MNGFAGIVIPWHLAGPLWRLADLEEVRQDVRGRHPDLDAVLWRWAELAAQHPPRRRPATSLDGPSQPDGASTEMTTAQVAARHSITTAAVTKAAREGRLPGRRVGDRWAFAPADVAAWAASRARGA